jgi:CubicO group peptidase (beta-lactamase class C family)
MDSAAGLTAAGLKGLHAAAERHVGDEKVPGLVALAARGGQVHVEALGRLAVGGPPVTRDSIFRIASTTKPITAAATLALAAEGLIGLDQPVDRLLPELAGRRVLRSMDGPLDDTVPAARAVTVGDLLTFTFGFGMVGEMFAAAQPWPVVAATGELRLATIGPPDPPVPPDPDTWIAAQVLGVLAARAAGQPFSEVLTTRIFEPLGMRDTGFWTADTHRLATAYQPAPGGLAVLDEPGGKWSRPPQFGDGAAGLVSTADDLLAFARMLLRGGAPVLPPDAVRAMTTDQLTPAQKAHGGLLPRFFDGRSWGFCQAVYDSGAFGWDGGLGTSWLVDPSQDLTVIVLTQRMFESPDPPQVHRDIQAAAYAALA